MKKEIKMHIYLKKAAKACGMIIMIFGMIFCFAPKVNAALPAAVTKSHPIITYPLNNRKIAVCEEYDLKKRVDTISGLLLSISKEKSGALHISYEKEGEKKSGWIRKSMVYQDTEYKPVQSFAAFRTVLYQDKSLKKKLIDVPLYVGGLLVGEYNKQYQVMFYINGKYYLGWMSMARYKAGIRQSMDTSEAPLADGYYAFLPRKDGTKALCWDHKKKTVGIADKDNTKYQKFYLKTVTGNAYAVMTYGKKYYVCLDRSGKLILTKKLTRWYIERKNDSFILKHKNSGSGIAYSKTGRMKAVKWNDASDRQMWTITKVAGKASDKTYTVYSQYDPAFGGSTYCAGNPVRTISTSGCGVVSYVNAIYALNGEYISASWLAQYSNANGHYVYMQGTKDSLYAAFANAYGKKYHFRYSGMITDFNLLRAHLKKGGTAVALVPGHYIAVVDYNSKNDTFMFLDSAITGSRPTTMTGNWITPSQMRTGRLYCYHFHLFSRR